MGNKEVREEIKRIITDASSNAVKRWTQTRPDFNRHTGDGFWHYSYGYDRLIEAGDEIQQNPYSTVRAYKHHTSIHIDRQRFITCQVPLKYFANEHDFCIPIPLITSYWGNITIHIETRTKQGKESAERKAIQLRSWEAKWAWHHFDQNAKDVRMDQLLAKYVDGDMQL